MLWFLSLSLRDTVILSLRFSFSLLPEACRDFNFLVAVF